MRASALTIVLALLSAAPPPDRPADAVDSAKAGRRPEIKRIGKASEEDLRKELLLAPQLGFDQAAALALYRPVLKARDAAPMPPDLGPRAFLQIAARSGKPDAFALPFRPMIDCQLGKESAQRLHVLSQNLRTLMRRATPTGDVRPDADRLREFLGRSDPSGGGVRPEEWHSPEAIPTLTQMLQVENTPLRGLLIEMLAKIPGKEAGTALAVRAVFDLSPALREQAVQALADRPQDEYRDVFVSAVRYPWAPPAEHAAEALTALKVKSAVPDLLPMMDEPDPAHPFQKDKTFYVREVVRINHLTNCYLCHAPSVARDDLVRGRAPTPGEPDPPAYYAAQEGAFIRADLTYLRQDFSVPQPVDNPWKWTAIQRYDYLQRARRALPQEVKLYQKFVKDEQLPKTYRQREATLFALKALLEIDQRTPVESLRPLMKQLRREEK